MQDWTHIALIAAITMLIGVARAGFGGSLALLAVPVMSLVMPARTVAGLLLPVMIVSDIFAVWIYRRDCDWRQIKWLLPGSLVGILIGTLTLELTDDTGLKRILGSICIGFVVIHILRRHILKAEEGLKPGFKTAATFGAAGGYTSTLAHAGGPVMVMFLLPQQLPAATFAGTTICYFAILNIVKLPPYIQQSLITGTTLQTSLWMLPFMLIGTGIGIWCNKRFSGANFTTIVMTLLVLAGLALLWMK